MQNQIAALNLLYLQLVGPASRRLHGITTVVIVPDGILHYVPFEALVRDCDTFAEGRRLSADDLYHDTPYLVRDYAFADVSSILDLPRLARTMTVASRNHGRYLGIGFDWTKGGCYQSHNLPPLQLAEQELRDVSRIITASDSAWNTAVIAGDHASRSRFLAELPHADIIHVATHGICLENTPESSVLLFPHAENGVVEHVTPDDIIALRLRARLVLLSACRSGSGHLDSSNGLRGIAEAFGQAGAEAIVASLWSLCDSTAHFYARTFFEHLMNGATVVAACRSAQRLLLRKNADPLVWAPFSCRFC
jgi:CHAT domain-containing protein